MRWRIKFICCLIAALLTTLFGLSHSFAQVKHVEVYNGLCDASAAMALDQETFIVASDEDNILRIFDRGKPEPKQTIPLSDVFKNIIFDGEDLEIDIEASAQLGNKIFWLGSHSTSKKGKFRSARNRLFAVQITSDTSGKFIALPTGNIYTSLISDLEKDPRFAKLQLTSAKAIEPKGIGGLSIEGLAATPDGALLIGFRNPLSGGKVVDGFLTGGRAFVVKLLNPLQIIDGKPAKFDASIELDLGGFGIRSLEYDSSGNQYLIAAGPYHQNEETTTHKREVSRLYTWSGKSGDSPKWLSKTDLSGFNVEAAFFFPKSKRHVELFSDDGTSTACTDTNKSFRGLWQEY